ncbi:hypothetical protein [Cellulomonas endophytica]|uniref:hypothetical protein n=1 Tax=Cellulomonas endophytica TaxID=2494735 RepID=UPI0010138D5C|nr:hypothetical protein [Cellulomonas endophytica]
MNTLVLLTFLHDYTTRARTTVRTRLRSRLGGHHHEAGLATLEMVIIALGLIAVATVLVLAITAAVQRRVDQIT